MALTSKPGIFKKFVKVSFASLAMALASTSANAALIKFDFQNPGDGLLILDTATDIEWLSPLVTAGQSYSSVVGGFGGLVTSGGFSTADRATVLSMFNANFGNPTTAVMVANFPKAEAFMDTFGVAELVVCPSANPPGPCPRTQAWAVDGTTLSGLGMITLGGTHGQVIDFSGTVGAFGGISDGQRGVWLIRAASDSVPEPATLALLGLGLAGIGFSRGRRRHSHR